MLTDIFKHSSVPTADQLFQSYCLSGHRLELTSPAIGFWISAYFGGPAQWNKDGLALIKGKLCRKAQHSVYWARTADVGSSRIIASAAEAAVINTQKNSASWGCLQSKYAGPGQADLIQKTQGPFLTGKWLYSGTFNLFNISSRNSKNCRLICKKRIRLF